MRYTGPAGIPLSDGDLQLVHLALLHMNTPDAIELRHRIREHLDARDFARTVTTHAQARTWTPPLHR